MYTYVASSGAQTAYGLVRRCFCSRFGPEISCVSHCVISWLNLVWKVPPNPYNMVHSLCTRGSYDSIFSGQTSQAVHTNMLRVVMHIHTLILPLMHILAHTHTCMYSSKLSVISTVPGRHILRWHAASNCIVTWTQCMWICLSYPWDCSCKYIVLPTYVHISHTHMKFTQGGLIGKGFESPT